jgi:hypothetical protein
MRILPMLVALFSITLTTGVLAADKKERVVEIGGMSIIGNRELPKTLYIVPWKDSEIDSETDLSRDLLNERLKVVDQEEFSRQLKYYDLSK